MNRLLGKGARLTTLHQRRTMKEKYLTANPMFNLTIGAIAISFSGVWVKLADVTPTSSAFYRVFIGLLFLLLFAKRSHQQYIQSWVLLAIGVVCGLLFALDLVCWHTSIRFIGPGLATLLGNFQVFILAGVGIFFLKESYSKLLLLAVPLAIVGLLMIVGIDWFRMGTDFKLGIGFGLATAVFYSGYILCLKQLSIRVKDKFYPMILVSFTTALIIGGSMIISGTSFGIPDLKSLVSLAGLGFLSQCFGWVCIASSLPNVKTSFAGLILLLQPSLAFIWDVMIFDRPTELLNWIGVCITLAAIYLGLKARN